jgi:hypothetical protein
VELDLALPDGKAFANWYTRAGVRSDPRRTIEAGDDREGTAFFPPHLVPQLNHPLSGQAPEPVRRYLAAQHLFQWLRFTAHFEVRVVNRAAERIANGNSGLELPVAAELTAFKVYVDEGYHSLYSLDVMHQVSEQSGIPALPYDFERFLARLDGVGADHPQHRVLIQLLQVVVFETLVTSILADIPNDRRVLPIVRRTVRDHAIDEGRHHAFFASFFTHLWGQLDPPTRALVARLLPDLVVESLQPATAPARAALLAVGFRPSDVDTVVAEAYDRDSVLAYIRTAAAKTLLLFEDRGVLDLPGARDGFVRAGLIDG